MRSLVLASLLALLPGLSWSQETESAAEPVTEESDQSAATTVAEPELEQPPTDAETSPFDYQASEQISEDLSVSFPVDI